MKKPKALFIFFLLIAIVLSSCVVVKRRYTYGWHIERQHPVVTAAIKQHNSTALEPALAYFPKKIPVSGENGSPPSCTEFKGRKKLKSPGDTCDVIIFKDGSEIKAKVQEVNINDVKYKRCENLDGPAYVSRKSDIFMIKYRNGTKDVMKQEPVIPTYQTPTQTTYQPPPPRTTEPLSIVSFVLSAAAGLIAFLSLIVLSSSVAGVWPVSLIAILVGLALASVIAGAKANAKIKLDPQHLTGKGFTIPAFIIAGIQLFIWLIIALIKFTL